MSSKPTYCCALLISACVLTLLPSMVFASECEKGIAVAISIQGSVEQKKENQWAPVKRNDTFCAGDTIRIRKNSRAIVRLVKEQTNITLSQNTTISFSGQTDKKSTWLELLKGAANFISRVPQVLKIKTPYVNAAVEGTEFIISVKKDKTTVSVFEGHVVLSNQNGKLDLKSGDTGLTEAHQAPTQTLKVNQVDAVQWTMYYPPVISKPKTAPDENDPAYLTYQASKNLTVGRLDQAAPLIEKALAINNKNSNALALKAIIAVVKNNKEGALIFAKQAVEANKTSAAYIALSYAHQAHFDLTHALDAAKQATKIESSNGIAWARLAELWLSQGDLDKALSAAKNATKHQPDLAHTQSILGFSYLTKIKTGKAKKAFEKAISLDQAAPLPHLGLGLAMIREGYLEQGRIEIEAATSLDPRNSLIRSYMGKVYYEEKRNNLAAKQFSLAKQLDPKDPTPWFYDSIRKQVENDPIGALNDLQESVNLNDNRAVYRSSLLLDNDEAARSASQARIYKDLGFEQLSLLESWKSLSYDPSNYSAHRLLADSYSNLPQHEIARVSEILQAQLLQPINANPIQPQLAESTLSILEGAGPSDLSLNEFNPLFVRNGMRYQANVVVGNNSTLGDDLLLSGIQNNFSFSLGQFHYETDGFRDNNDTEHNIYNLFIQSRITNKINAQFEYRNTEKENGDTRINTLQPGSFKSALRQQTESDLFRIGINYKPENNSTFLASLVTNSIDFISSDTSADATRNDEGDSVELVHLGKYKIFNTVSGLGLTEGKSKTKVSLNQSPFVCSIIPIPCETNTNEDINHKNLFFYTNFEIDGNGSTIIAGLSASDIKNNLTDDSFINPKLGAILNINHDNLLRFAAFKTTKRDLLNSQTLEPTQIAGFNQFYDDFKSAEGKLYGIGYDVKFSKKINAGISYYDRTSNFPFTDRIANTIDSAELEFQNGNIYSSLQLNSNFNLNVELQYEQFKAPTKFTRDILKLDTIQVPVTFRYFNTNGISTGFTLAYVNQEGSFRAPVATKESDKFYILNYSISYRLPKRLGLFSFEVKNLTNEEYKFLDPQTSTPIFSPERYIIGKFTLNI